MLRPTVSASSLTVPGSGDFLPHAHSSHDNQEESQDCSIVSYYSFLAPPKTSARPTAKTLQLYGNRYYRIKHLQRF